MPVTSLAIPKKKFSTTDLNKLLKLPLIERELGRSFSYVNINKKIIYIFSSANVVHIFT